MSKHILPAALLCQPCLCAADLLGARGMSAKPRFPGQAAFNYLNRYDHARRAQMVDQNQVSHWNDRMGAAVQVQSEAAVNWNMVQRFGSLTENCACNFG
jgi:hypothetical protein